jgi:hypothetical protein
MLVRRCTTDERYWLHDMEEDDVYDNVYDDDEEEEEEFE